MQVGTIVSRVSSNYQDSALALVGRAYSTIRVGDLATYLGQVDTPGGMSGLS